MDTNAVILDAVERVAGGRDDALVVHSARDSNLWVQISRVEGETSLLCEAVGDEYLGRLLGDLATRFDQARRFLNHLTDQYLFPVRNRWFPAGGG